MPSTKEVCESFFNFKCYLNRGHGLIASIYSLIFHSKKNDSSYFNGLDEQIKRVAIDCDSISKLLDILELGLNNVSHDIEYPVTRPNWTTISYMFYVTDKIDTIARARLSINDYSMFKMKAATSLEMKLESIHGGILTEKSWYNLMIMENCKHMSEHSSFAWSEFFIGMSTLYLMNKFT